MRGDGDKMQHLCVHLQFYRSQPSFLPEPQSSQRLPVMVYTSHVPAHFYSLKVQITGEVAEECKDGCVVLSRKAAASPQALPQNKARILDTAGTSAVEMQLCAGLGSSAVPSNFAPFGLTDNTGNMKLYYQ